MREGRVRQWGRDGWLWNGQAKDGKVSIRKGTLVGWGLGVAEEGRGRGRRRVDTIGLGGEGKDSRGVSLGGKGAEEEYRKGRNGRRPDW